MYNTKFTLTSLGFSNEIDLQEGETKRLQEAVSQLDEDTKQSHRQYALNRDNIER